MPLRKCMTLNKNYPCWHGSSPSIENTYYRLNKEICCNVCFWSISDQKWVCKMRKLFVLWHQLPPPPPTNLLWVQSTCTSVTEFISNILIYISPQYKRATFCWRIRWENHWLKHHRNKQMMMEEEKWVLASSQISCNFVVSKSSRQSALSVKLRASRLAISFRVAEETRNS